MPSPPKVTLVQNGLSYDSLDEAAHSFLSPFLQHPQEHAGVILRNPQGKYELSTSAPGDHDNFSIAAQIPKGYSLAAILHNHPGDDDMGNVFSPNDLAVAKQLKVPSYVGFSKDGSIRRYTAGETQTRSLQMPGERNTVKVADGDPITLPQPTPQTTPLLAAQTVPVEGSRLLAKALYNSRRKS
jgi:hypothetical protein